MFLPPGGLGVLDVRDVATLETFADTVAHLRRRGLVAPAGA
jgi:hypothetical protein